MNTSGTIEIISRSPAQTRKIAADIINRRPGRIILALNGELGSGKTCFVQGVAAALNCSRPVASPTFTLINEYPGTRRLFHVDLYRLANHAEISGLGLEEMFDTQAAVVAIEWADKAGPFLPAETIRVDFSQGRTKNSRTIIIRDTAAGTVKPP